MSKKFRSFFSSSYVDKIKEQPQKPEEQSFKHIQSGRINPILYVETSTLIKKLFSKPKEPEPSKQVGAVGLITKPKKAVNEPGLEKPRKLTTRKKALSKSR